jgi:hypothetical protein
VQRDPATEQLAEVVTVNRLPNLTPDWSAPPGLDSFHAAILTVCRAW